MWQAAGERSLRIACRGPMRSLSSGNYSSRSATRATKRVENEVAWPGVMKDVGDDAAWRDLRVVGVRAVDRIVFALLDVCGKRRPVVVIRLRAIRSGVFCHEVAEGLVV